MKNIKKNGNRSVSEDTDKVTNEDDVAVQARVSTAQDLNNNKIVIYRVLRRKISEGYSIVP